VHWVQVRLQVKCLTCQRSSPVNRLALDGRFYCIGCSREMFFDEDIWEEKITPFASALGDAFWSLVGVFPAFPQIPNVDDVDEMEELYDDIGSDIGVDDFDLVQHLFKKCNEVGRETSGLTMSHESGMVISGGGMKTGAFSLEMSPGHPLCPQCKTPIGVQVVGEGLVSTSCARCGARENYRAPEDASDLGIAAVIASEHVDGREVARVAAQPGSAALAVACPKCGSSLQFSPGARIANCPYCKTTSVVPDHVAAAGSPAGVRPEPIWLGMRSPSPARQAIVEGLQGRAVRNTERANEQSRQQEQARMREEEEKKTGEPPWVGVVMAAGACIAAGVAIYFAVASKHQEASTSSAAATSTHVTKTAKPPPAPEPVPIGSCKCAFGDGQSTPQITLQLQAPPSDGSIPWSLEIVRHSGFVEEETGVRLPAAPGALLPPAPDTAAPDRMGIACDTGIFVLVADKVATGWSSVNGSWKWNATLPSPSVDAVNADVAAMRGSSYSGGCVPLAVKNGALALKLANGKHVSLSLKDGKVH
jgi:hypothetical protein